MGPVSVEIGSENDSLVLAVKIGSVEVTVVIRAEAEMIADNANVTVNENVDLEEGIHMQS